MNPNPQISYQPQNFPLQTLTCSTMKTKTTLQVLWKQEDLLSMYNSKDPL